MCVPWPQASVFFADDAMLLITNEDEAKQNIKLLIKLAEDCGLQLSKEKWNISIFNSNSTTENIEEIRYSSNKVFRNKNNEVELSL